MTGTILKCSQESPFRRIEDREIALSNEEDVSERIKNSKDNLMRVEMKWEMAVVGT